MKSTDYSRRDFLSLVGMGAAALAFPGCKGLSDKSSPSVTTTKPNFIIIFTDDQGYQDVGCFGAPKIKTPNLDRMAAEGKKFTDFYSAASVCSPSRAALLTGCYPPRVSIPSVLFPRHKMGLNPDEITIADILKEQGYATACIGKWHLGHLPDFLPTRHGFDYYFGLPYSNDMWPKQTGRSNYPPLPLIENETTIDFLPTLAKLAGGQTPTERIIDGKDIGPLLTGPAGAKTPHEAFYYYRGNRLEAVRAGHWKLRLPPAAKKKSKNQEKPKPPQPELYDLSRDISEKNNLAAQQPEIVEKLTNRMKEFDQQLKQNTRPAGKIF